MNKKRPPTKMVRVRVQDIEQMKILAHRVHKKLPDFQRDLINFYRRKKKILK